MKVRRRPEPKERAISWDELWLAVKSQSRLAIAGSPRDSFRASVQGFFAGVEHWMGQGGVIPTCSNQTPNTAENKPGQSDCGG